MNIRDLQYLVAVADVGHFRRAAETCFVSQPTLSGQIRKLEQHLGVVVFERTNRSVRLTPVGKQIVDKARAALRVVDEIEETAQAWRDPCVGPLRIGLIPTIGPYLIPLILAELKRKLPGLEIIVCEEITTQLLHHLEMGELDAAVIATSSENPKQIEIPLYTEPFCVAMPNGHPLALADEISLEALEQCRLLLLADGHCFRDQVISACHTAPQEQNINTRATSLETILALVAADEGITLIPALANPGALSTAQNLSIRPVDSDRTQRMVRIVCRASYPRKSIIERIANIIRTQIPDSVSPPSSQNQSGSLERE